MTDKPDPQPEDPSPEFQQFEELARRLFALPPDEAQAVIDSTPHPPVDTEAPNDGRKNRTQAVKR